MWFQKKKNIINFIYIYENKLFYFNHICIDFMYSFYFKLLILGQASFANSAFVIKKML